jgi:hypothetical protein
MLSVDEPGPLKYGHKVIKVTMNVANRDYVFRFVRRGFGSWKQRAEGGAFSCFL